MVRYGLRSAWAAWLCLTTIFVPTSALHAGEKEDLLAAVDNAQALVTKADYVAAERECERALALAPHVFDNDLDTASILNRIANAYCDMGRHSQAEQLYQRSLDLREASLGPDHLEVAHSLNNLAFLYGAMGQYPKAEPLYQRCLKVKEASLGPDNLDVALSLDNLADLYRDMGEYEKAEPHYLRSLKVREAKLGPDDLDVAVRLTKLGRLYVDMGRYVDAEPLYQRSLKIREEPAWDRRTST